MSNILTTVLLCEGSTDRRFLTGIISRTCEDLLWNSTQQIEVFEPLYICKSTLSEARRHRGDINGGHHIIFIHVDADLSGEENAMENTINPIIEDILEETSVCVPIIPIYMTEAWMLADKNALKNELNTSLTDRELGIEREAERIANPKGILTNAIRIVEASLTKRKRGKLTIGQLYTPLSLDIDLTLLEQLNSYNIFKSRLQNALREIGYL